MSSEESLYSPSRSDDGSSSSLRASTSSATETRGCKNLYSLRNVKFEKPIGTGAFGSVYRGLVSLPRNANDSRSRQLLDNGHVIAVKAISKAKVAAKRLEKQLALEIKVHQLMVHPNIIRFLDYSHDGKDVYIFLEYADGGDLLKYVRKHEPSEVQFASLMRQLGQAVEFVHGYGIAHRDLKPENVLMLGDVPKLTDFGYCDKVDSQGMCKNQFFCGTTDFLAPEMCQGEDCGLPVDVWAFSCIIFDLRTGKPPFYAPSRDETYKRILACDVDLNEPAVRNVQTLLRQIFVTNPDERPTMKQVLKHKWFSLK